MREIAQIEDRDVQVGLEMAWHQKTIVVPVVTFEKAYPYEIKRVPVYFNGPTKDKPKASIFQKVPGQSVFICSDDHKPVGKPVADTYHAMTNQRFWEIVNNSLGGTGAVIESAGTLKDRTRRFITIRLAQNGDFVIGKRRFKNRISLLDSIDETTYFIMVGSSICVVCANTFRHVQNDRAAEVRCQVKHTSGMPDKIEAMEARLDGLMGVRAQFQAALEHAAEVKIDERSARQLFAGFLGEKAKGKLSTRAENNVDRLTALFRGGAGNEGKTILDVFSAATDYYSHESSGGEDKPGFRLKQFESSEMGAGANRKEAIYQDLFTYEKGMFRGMNTERIAQLTSMGEALLAAN